MANMYYCMFRNTMDDFRNCVDAICNADSIDDFSNAERKAAERLYHLANEYVAYYEQLLEESGE
ncbi:hypothetical protein BOX16_gp36 [Salmonella phage 64795_sal3]|uniref:Uncharacterized protein n=1 Tax=Salmonella phage 64795_sal3 TaxID=1813769 RepID=A0A173GC80_9CAUD|nr:hypothetical protein BOX16_gp36 [Salmonella phage 64795_sal3]ANH50870.1 hypothetical protein [Salmonella phage 64795_sal3]